MSNSCPRLPFNGVTVTQQTDLCLNRRHRAAGCTQCITNCPVDAITLVGGAPALDTETCIRCGLCLHSCPTGVFIQPNAAEPQLLHAAAQLPGQPIMLVCARHPTPAHTTAPVNTIVQHRRCLAALSVEQLLALSQDGTRAVWLDDTSCVTCPLGAAQDVLQQSVTTVNALLQAFARPVPLYLQSKQGDQPVDKASHRPLIDAGNPPVTRRGLFAALGRTIHTQRSTTQPTASAPNNDPQPSTTRLPQQVPPSRRALQARLQQWEAPADENIDLTNLPFAAVQVDPARCSACGLCTRFCPTGALQFVAEDEQFSLSFQPAICLNCPICMVACPEDAIQLGDALPAAALVTQVWAPLVEGRLTPCAQCGVPTADQSGDPGAARCYSCRQGAGLVQSLRDGAGLMADLLQRLSNA